MLWAFLAGIEHPVASREGQEHMSRLLRSGGRFAQGCGIVAAFFMFTIREFLYISFRRVEISPETEHHTEKTSRSRVTFAPLAFPSRSRTS